jgi:hypothetical protein
MSQALLATTLGNGDSAIGARLWADAKVDAWINQLADLAP